MKINWKVRFRNPSFWVSVAIALVTPVLAYMGITAADITTWGAVWGLIKGAFSNPYVLLMVAVSVYNTVIDPTTTGVTDSSRALNYSYPSNIKDLGPERR